MANFWRGGVLRDPDDRDEIQEAIDERERQAEQAAAEAKEIAAAQREEDIAQILSALEMEIQKAVHVELAQEIAARKLPPETWAEYKEDMAAFRKWCARFNPALPHSPAAPQAVAGFLASIANTGNVERAAAAISRAHKAAANSEADPTNDYLVKAILKFLKDVPPAEKPAN